MHTKAVFPGKYIQGQGILYELPELIKTLGTKGMILASPTVIEKILPGYLTASFSDQFPVELFNGECCEAELDRLSVIIQRDQPDMIVGMGGGKTIDTAKIAANRAGIPVIIVPTIAATDAPCSGCAVIYTPEGVFEGTDYQKMNPAAVLVDMDVIAGAPTRFLVSGMGDALATWFEARSCEHTHSMNECGGQSTLAGLHIARLCYETLMKYGVLAKMASEQHLVTPALNYIAEANILLSGIGFESSGLAAAHAIHNGLTALEETHSYYHGEKVAFGVLAGLQLNGALQTETDEVYDFCLKVGLPVTLEDIGLDYTDRDKLLIAAEKACAPGQAIHHEPGKIIPEKVVSAMLMADAIGRSKRLHIGTDH
jgi:glycerol dehydrogenase